MDEVVTQVKMAKKRIVCLDRTEVIYDEERWRILRELREKATGLMEALSRFNIDSIVHGSIARGDVSPKSDVDVFVQTLTPSFLIETALESAHIKPSKRLIVQATPTYAIKGHLEIDSRTIVSFPLVKFKSEEVDFYKFGGCVNLQQIKANVRTPGVDKRLMLIEPTEKGHVESSIIGKEEFVARYLGVGVGIVRERVRTLLRRKRVGRTGVFVKRELTPDESFEEVLRGLAEEIPIIRKRVLLR